MVTVVLPSRGPDAGLRPVTSGRGSYVYISPYCVNCWPLVLTSSGSAPRGEPSSPATILTESTQCASCRLPVRAPKPKRHVFWGAQSLSHRPVSSHVSPWRSHSPSPLYDTSTCCAWWARSPSSRRPVAYCLPAKTTMYRRCG